MRSNQIVSGVLALASSVSAQVASKVTCDAITKICFSSYTVPNFGVTFGIALPQNVTAPYDAIVSITAPITTYWAGLAWGGTMVWNPLTVAWANGTTAVASSRFAFGIGLPPAFDGAEYTLMKGTTTNATHWTMVARCRGCTSYKDSEDNLAVVNGSGIATLAWAHGNSAVQDPTKNDTAFNVHDGFGKWEHDMNAARSSNFNSWVSSNLLTSSPGSATSTASTTGSASTLVTSATAAAPKATGAASAAIPASCSGAGAASFGSTLAAGWKATKVLGGLTNPRSIVFDTAGNMLIVQAGKGVSVHAMDQSGCPTSSKMLISANNLNHGIALSPDGKTLYTSSMTQAYSQTYDAAAGTVGTRNIVVSGMYNGGAHLTRTLEVSPANPNLLVVSHGSNDNFDYAAGNSKTGRAIVKVFDMSQVPTGGYNYPNGGYLAGYGMRNEVGICWDKNNMLWGVENSGDNFQRTPMTGGSKKDVHTDNPAEKLHYIGDVSKPNNNWYGYPTCYTVWKPSDFSDSKFQIGDWFVVSPNSTFDDSKCKDVAVAPALNFQAHSAPIDCKFDADNSNLYVTFHGSWNRQPTTGFKLVVVPFKKGSDGKYTPSSPASSGTGYTDVMANPDVTKCAGNGPSFSSGCFRPSGLGFDKGGRLYMTSDVSSGEIWVLGKS